MADNPKHSPGALALLEEARSCLERADEIHQSYNSIRDELLHLGYLLPIVCSQSALLGGPDTFAFGSWALDDYFAKGPISKEDRRRAYLKTLKRPKLLLELGKDFCWTCIYCQKSGTPERGPDDKPWHVDHGYPRALGGDNDPDNYILACATCNTRKGKKTAMELLNRILESAAK